MNIDWDGLESAGDWKKALESILKAGRRASDTNDDDERLALCKLLRTFVQKSFPNTKPIADYDRIAMDAQQALSTAVVAGAIDRIAARSTTLIGLGKQIAQVTEQNEAEAAVLRLEKAHTLVDALTDTARALDDFDTVLVEGEDDDLAARVAQLAEAVAKIRTLVQKQA